MNEIQQTCPKCGCSHLHSEITSTSDAHPDGPAYEHEWRECGDCGWAQEIQRERGKTVSVKEASDDRDR